MTAYNFSIPAGGIPRYDAGGGNYGIGSAPVGFTHGQTVVIPVSGLTSTSVSEYLFTGGAQGMIEQASLGQAVSVGSMLVGKDTYYTSNADDIDVVSDAVRGKVWYSHPGGATEYNGAVQFNFSSPLPENTKFRATFWLKRVLDNPSATGQHKVWRIRSGSNQYPETATFYWNNGNGYYLDFSPGDADAADSRYWQNYVELTPDVWRKTAIEIDTGTSGGADGYFKVFDYQSGGITLLTSSEITQGSVDVYTGTNRFERFVLQGYPGNGLGPMELWYDDLSVQIGSWRSVEITNNETYLSSTLSEEQEILGWDTGAEEVTFRLNRGGLSNGSYWVHVRDDTGAVILTMPLVIGS